MEAPTVIKPFSPPFIHQYILNNLNYEIELNNYYTNFYIKLTNKSKIEKYFYIFEDTLENLFKLDKYFMIFENIDEIKNNINELLKEKEHIELKTLKENEVILIIKVSIGKQIKNIEFPLIKKEINDVSLINLLKLIP